MILGITMITFPEILQKNDLLFQNLVISNTKQINTTDNNRTVE